MTRHERPATTEPAVSELASSIFCREFIPVYEPVVELATGAALGWQAHGRWIHPTRGLLTPAEYRPIAERSGLLSQIDGIIIDRALRRFRRWSGGRCSPNGPWLAIGLPASRLGCGVVAESLNPLLSHYSIPASRVMLEISQLASVASGPPAYDELAEWRRQGGSWAVDAADVGCRTFDHLHCPVDVVKLSRDHVHAVTDQGRREAWAADVVDQANRTGARVIAEGVETDEQRRVLTRIGCHGAQGLLVGAFDDDLVQPVLPLYAS